jgi:hypothetical protein
LAPKAIAGVAFAPFHLSTWYRATTDPPPFFRCLQPPPPHLLHAATAVAPPPVLPIQVAMSTTTDAPSHTIPPLNNTGPALFINPYSIVAVRSHVLVVLEMKNPNYSKWSSFFKTMCGKFGLSSHLNTASTADTTDAAWV